MPYIYPIILSGGTGSRLWPLSRRRLPKQLLALVGQQSLIQETALRAVGDDFAKPLIICHKEHRLAVAEQMRAIGVQPENIILEPVGRNTAPAAAVAALIVAEKDPGAVLVLMPADHVVHDQEALHRAIIFAQDLAMRGHLVALGVHPGDANTGYGYIQRGSALADGGKAFAVSRFVEKPNAEAAKHYASAGDYYWNSGIFAFQAKTYLAELQTLEPDILMQCQKALSRGTQDGDCFHLARESFETCKSISIDYAIMEHTDKAVIIPVEMGWSDVGSWSALWEISSKDANGNAVKGDVVHEGTRNSYLRSEAPLIAALGVNDLVVVATKDSVLVSSKSATQDVKKIVERLEREGRNLPLADRRVRHAWGCSEQIDQGSDFQVSSITINPGATLLLGPDQKRIGRWVIVSGAGRIMRGDETRLVTENETCALSGDHHRLENVGSGPLHVIETRVLPH